MATSGRLCEQLIGRSARHRDGGSNDVTKVLTYIIGGYLDPAADSDGVATAVNVAFIRNSGPMHEYVASL